jgi:hypothetical protein
VLSLALAALAAGCFPIASMRWSDDGSVGVVATNEKGRLVDGRTGQAADLPPLAGWVPSVTPDGKHVLYAVRQVFETAEAALAALPKAQQALVAKEADLVTAAVLAGDAGPGTVTEWPALEHEPLGGTAVYRNLVLRAVCERADDRLTKAVAPGMLEHAKAQPAAVVQLRMAPIRDAAAGEGRAVAASLYTLTRPRLSPDGRLVAYLCHAVEDGKGGDAPYDLWVSPLEGEPASVRLAANVAIGYAWRPDGRAVAYVSAVGEEGGRPIIGTLTTLEVVDADGTLLAQEAEGGGDADHVASAEPGQRAGVIFNRLASAAYLPSGRLLFSSIKVALPMSHLEGDPRQSLFAFDSVTGALADILPTSVSARMGGQAHFELSPDGSRVLVPLGDEGFLVYGIGEAEAKAPLPAGTAAGSKAPPPAWKGPDHVACWVKRGSDLLKGADLPEGGEDEVLAEVDLDGNLVRVLLAP